MVILLKVLCWCAALLLSSSSALVCYKCVSGRDPECIANPQSVHKCNAGEVCQTFAIFQCSNASYDFNVTDIYGVIRRCISPTDDRCDVKSEEWGSCVYSAKELNCVSCCKSDKCNVDIPDWLPDKTGSGGLLSAQACYVIGVVVTMFFLR